MLTLLDTWTRPLTLVVLALDVIAVALQVVDGADVAVVAAGLGVAVVAMLGLLGSGRRRGSLLLPAFVASLLGHGVVLGVVGLGSLSSPFVLVAALISAVVCVCATLVRAERVLDEPRDRW